LDLRAFPNGSPRCHDCEIKYKECQNGQEKYESLLDRSEKWYTAARKSEPKLTGDTGDDDSSFATAFYRKKMRELGLASVDEMRGYSICSHCGFIFLTENETIGIDCAGAEKIPLVFENFEFEHIKKLNLWRAE
jgi:hypothetical protein